MPIKASIGAASTWAAYSVAGAGCFAPLALMHPSAQDRLEAQATKWAPRWERGVTHFTRPIEIGVKRIEPHAAAVAHAVSPTAERAAKAVDSTIRRSIDGIDSRNKRIEVNIKTV